jgi:hypothetical protein
MTQTLLSAAAILQNRDRKFEDVLVPEWPNPDGTPGAIRLQEMSAFDFLEMNELVKAAPSDGMYYMLIYCAVDENFNRIFTVADLEVLRSKSMHVLTRLQMKGLELNRSPLGATDPNVSSGAPSGASPSA